MLKTIEFLNDTDFRRQEVGYATVPFAEGEWDGTSPLAITNQSNSQILEGVVSPFGARWPDGSVRFARLLTRLEMTSRQSQVILIQNSASSEPPVFSFSVKFLEFLHSGLTLSIESDGNVNYTTFNNPMSLSVLEDNGMRRVYRARSRLANTDFVYDLKIYVYSRQDILKFELSVTGSNPSNTKWMYSYDNIYLLLQGNGYINIRGMTGKGARAIDNYKTYQLASNGYFGDGQKLIWHGEIYLPIDPNDDLAIQSAYAAVASPLWGMSKDWQSSKAYGGLGVIPSPPNLVDNGRRQVSNIRNYFEDIMNRNANVWDDTPFGLTKRPGTTGDQYDFGLLDGWEVLFLGAPELVEGYYYVAHEDAKRPVNLLEMDGTPVTQYTHPNWVVWDQRTHFSTGVSTDRLGKTEPIYNSNWANGWWGKDWEHHSSNLLYLGAILTGSYALLDQINVEVDAMIAGHTLPSEWPRWSTNGRFAPRAFARVYRSMSAHYTITGRYDVVTKMLRRLHEVVLPFWDGATHGPVKNWDHGFDPRLLPKSDAWIGWQEGMGFTGAVALWNVTRDEVVKNFIITWGESLIRYAYKVTRDSNGSITDLTTGHGIAWRESGQPLSQQEMTDPTLFNPAGGLTVWALGLPACIKDSDWFSDEARGLAKEYYDFMFNQRMINYDPLNTPFDRWGRWEAI